MQLAFNQCNRMDKIKSHISAEAALIAKLQINSKWKCKSQKNCAVSLNEQHSVTFYNIFIKKD